MKKMLLLRAALSAVFGHASSLLFLFLSAVFCKDLADPEKSAFVISIIAYFLGSACSGLIARNISIGMLGGLLSGIIYSSIIFAGSFAANTPTHSLFIRLILCTCLVIISFVFSFFAPKRTKHSKSPAARRKFIYKKYN